MIVNFQYSFNEYKLVKQQSYKKLIFPLLPFTSTRLGKGTFSPGWGVAVVGQKYLSHQTKLENYMAIRFSLAGMNDPVNDIYKWVETCFIHTHSVPFSLLTNSRLS